MAPDDELLAIFRAEVEEQLQLLGELLEGEPGDWDLEQLFRLAHNVKGAARLVGADSVRDAAHALEDLFAALRRGVARGAPVARAARQGFDLLSACFEGSGAPDVASYRAAVDALLAAAPGGARRANGTSGNGKERTAEPRPVEGNGQHPADEPLAPETAPAGGETLRMNASKLDGLMSLTAEIATSAQRVEALREDSTRLTALVDELSRQQPALRDQPGFKAMALAARRLREDLVRHELGSGRLSGALEDGIRNLRMVRVDNLRLVLTRVLREACELTGREVQLRIDGGQVEVDRRVLDALRDPLVHLVRNAVSHGIEPAGQRRAAGKPERGTVRLEARSAGTWVEIEVADDGRGADLDALRRAATRRGVAYPAHALEAELLEMLFEPGFSTLDAADSLSGRGVGLDVVRRGVAGLGGEVTLRSRPGAGASFRLRVPLTRLTTKALLVRLGEQTFAFPAASVERALSVDRGQIRTADGQSVVHVDGQPIPVVPLERPLGMSARPRDSRPGVVLAEGPHRRVLLVDDVLGEHDVVMQPLAWNLRRVTGISGCTVLRGERVVPTLDVAALLGATAGRALEDEAQAARTARQRRLLVVDDSVTSRTLERNILASAGYDVQVAINGQQAWELLQKKAVDLVISDVDMPIMSGLELTSRIRGARELERLPVILVTSLGDEEHKQRGADAGADAYIVKGAFDQDELLKAVSRLL